MKFTIPKNDFAAVLQTVSRAVSSSAVVPALSGILVTAEDGELRLVGSNSSISIEATVTAQVEQEGSLTSLTAKADGIPSSQNRACIRRMPAQDLQILPGLQPSVRRPEYS